MPARDPVERVLQARMAAHTKWGLVSDRAAATQPLRDGRWQRLLAQVDEACPGLPEDERIKRATNLRKAQMQALAIASVKARRAKKLGRLSADLDAEESALLAQVDAEAS